MKFNRKKIIVVSIISILVLACLGYFTVSSVKNYLIRKDPVNWVVYGTYKTYTAESLDASSKTTLKFQSSDNGSLMDTIIAKVINNLSLKTNSSYSKAANETYYDFDVLYSGQDFVDLKLFVDKNGIIVSCPALYSENMFLNWSDINKIYDKNKDSKNQGSINIDNYKTIFNLDDSKNAAEVSKSYLQFFSQKLQPYFTKGGKSDVIIQDANGNSKTIKCDNLTLKIDSDHATEIFRQALNKAADDPKVKILIKDKFTQFFNIVDKNNDYSKFGLTKDDVKKFWNDYDSNYKDTADKIKQSGDNSGTSNYLANYNYIFKFDSNNIIRGTHSELNVSLDNSGTSSGKINITTDSTINSINEKVNVKKLSRDGALNLAAQDEAKLNDIGNEITSNFQSLISKKLGF